MLRQVGAGLRGGGGGDDPRAPPWAGPSRTAPGNRGGVPGAAPGRGEPWGWARARRGAGAAVG